jgi:hypothetical protein
LSIEQNIPRDWFHHVFPDQHGTSSPVAAQHPDCPPPALSDCPADDDEPELCPEHSTEVVMSP